MGHNFYPLHICRISNLISAFDSLPLSLPHLMLDPPFHLIFCFYLCLRRFCTTFQFQSCLSFIIIQKKFPPLLLPYTFHHSAYFSHQLSIHLPVSHFTNVLHVQYPLIILFPFSSSSSTSTVYFFFPRFPTLLPSYPQVTFTFFPPPFFSLLFYVLPLPSFLPLTLSPL